LSHWVIIIPFGFVGAIDYNASFLRKVQILLVTVTNGQAGLLISKMGCDALLLV
jgi:hypothetical protein